MLLAASALALSLVFGATNPSTPPPPSAPALPPTQPGASRDEGWFLFTSADDGSRLIYFIAGNLRHNILPADVQLELQVNPLWPERQATQDEVLAIAEGGPIGNAKLGLLGGDTAAQDAPAPAQSDAQPAPAEQTQQPTAAQPAATAPATTDSAPAQAPADPVVYVLRPGDNLTRIAAQYGTTIDAILGANGVSNANRIYAGQPLLIPSADGPASMAEDTSAPAPADDAAAQDAASTTYTVQPGDSAFKIARRFGIDQQALLDANGISNPNRVYAGQVLTIPSA